MTYIQKREFKKRKGQMQTTEIKDEITEIKKVFDRLISKFNKIKESVLTDKAIIMKQTKTQRRKIT